MKLKIINLCFLFFLMLCFELSHVYPQINNRTDELEKFSYLIYSNSAQFNYTATCFFIREDNRLFLVGAGHTFNNINSITGVTDPDYPDTISVIICKENQTNSCEIQIDISKIKKMSQPYKFTEEPEIYIHEIKERLTIEVNSIEEYIKDITVVDKKLIDQVFMYGYPNLGSDPMAEYNQINPSLSYGKILEKFTEFNYYEEINTYDYVNYLMKPAKDSKMGGGFSGAPCFFLINGEFHFGGVCIGGSENKRLVINVRPEQVIKKITKHKL